MKPTEQRQEGKGAVELIEEAFHLLRLAPASTLASYYLGTLPFILVLLFFWSDMSRSAFAGQRLPVGALGLSLFFFWMKIWQAVFAQELLAGLSREPPLGWSFSRLLRMGLVQCVLQPSGLFLLPLAFMILLPLGWTYAFYQNATVLGDGQETELRQVFARAWRQAKLWPAQNHCVLLLMQPFGLFVFLNLVTGVLGIPFLLNKFLGVDTIFTQSTSAMLNTTFFAAILGLTYLCVDPILKTIFALRCFYGESLKTGRDLKAELKNVQAPGASVGTIALVLLLGMAMPTNGSPDIPVRAISTPAKQLADTAVRAPAQEPGSRRSLPSRNRMQAGDALEVSPEVKISLQASAAAASPEGSLSPAELDRSINEVLHHREFSWRMPRERIHEQEESKKGPVALFFESIWETLQDWAKAVGRWLSDLFRWLGKYLRPRQSSGGTGTGWISTMYALLWLVAIALVCALVFLLFRVWQNWGQAPADRAAEAIVLAPDVTDENVSADELPEDGWLRLARELLEKGELRLALRAFYLASLARLAQGNLITIAKFKSNRDYERELQRRAHAFPEVLNSFAENVTVFDRVWYGLHEVNAELVAHFAGNVQKMSSPAASGVSRDVEGAILPPGFGP